MATDMQSSTLAAPTMRADRATVIERRLPIGAELLPDGRVSFRVWAPKCKRVEVCLQSSLHASTERVLPLEAETSGYFSGVAAGLSAGWLYGLRLDGSERLYPDPASRFQPTGPDGLSQLVDPSAYRWQVETWPGVENVGQVIYEMHIGTFTAEGTWQAAMKRLPDLVDLGITLLEVMPVADFPGRFGWGYDGVSMFAPTRLYGGPDDFRAFVDEAHRLGLGVILDVVYNHFGNEHNFIYQFAEGFRSSKYSNEWGDALNFDCDGCVGVREFFVTNARYWIEEFRLDGFRFDATQSIHDASDEHILGDITAAARKAAGKRTIFTAAENEPQDVRTVRPQSQGGHGMDAVWNDDFHHSARVCVTGQSRAYYSDYRGNPSELITCAKRGFIYQGQLSQWQKAPRGTATWGLNGKHFVSCLQNHDQVANSATGARLHNLTSPSKYRAITAVWLLLPHTPLFFQGQEFCASTPFLYFADPPGDAPKIVAKGRGEFLSQFANLAEESARERLALPHDPDSFSRCKLPWNELETSQACWKLHRDLLKLRREDAVFSLHDMQRIEAAVLADQAFVLRYLGDGEERLLLANFGRDVRLSPCPEPLLAPPENAVWEEFWTSESPDYGGWGIGPVMVENGWYLPADSVVLLRSIPATEK